MDDFERLLVMNVLPYLSDTSGRGEVRPEGAKSAPPS